MAFDPGLAIAAKASSRLFPFANMGQRADKVRKVAILGHSFVGGAGVTAPLTFGIPLAAALRAKYGDAGFGYVPWSDGKMGGISHTTNFTTLSSLGSGSAFYPWTDAVRSNFFNGLGYYRSGGIGGTDGNESASYTPNASDGFGRGVVDTLTSARVYFTLRSANSGFIIRQSNLSFGNSATDQVSSGATFTGSSAATVLTTSSVAGIIPRGGQIVTGLSDPTTIIGFGTGNGGAGTYAIGTSQTVASTSMSIPGNVSPTLNIPQTFTYYYSASGNQQLSILGIYGDVVISGVESFNGNAGVTVTDFGIGGTTAYQFASLDDTAQRRFWELAQFDLVIVILNMNDRTSVGPSAHGGNLASIVRRIKSCPKTQVLLVRETDPSDAATTYMTQYTEVLKNIASAMGCGYLDERQCPGFTDYATANGNGYMTDGVHRNGTGNTLMGNFYASKIIL